jgi:DNA-binding Xre family transcriptional regulator
MELKKFKLKNRLLVLIHEKELKEGRRIKQAEIAREINVANHTIGSWIRNDVTKFEAHIIEGLCAYFECQVGDLLYLEEDTDSK